MNRLAKTWGILLAVFCIAIFCCCANGNYGVNRGIDDGGYMRELGTHEGLSAEIELQILMDYVRHYNANFKGSFEPELMINDIWVFAYYGTYDGLVLLTIAGPWFYPDVMLNFFVADINFIFTAASKPQLWKDGMFYFELQEAYDLNLLTQDDLRIIAGRINS